MRRNGVLLPRADADRMKQIRTEIGRRVKEHYDVGKRPMSDRLAEVVRKIENRNGLCEEGLADTIFAPKVVAAIALGVQIGLQL